MKRCLPWILLSLAVIVRCLFLDFDSLWLDEINTMLVATVHGYPQTLPEGIWTPQQWFDAYLAWQPMDVELLMAMLKQNVHMPLYYLLLNPWLGWFGLSEMGLRSFSVLFSIFTLLVLWRFSSTLARHYKPEPSNESVIANIKRYWPLWTLIIAGFSPFQLTFAQEGRMYTLALFFSVLSAWSLFRWTNRVANNQLGQKRSLAIYTVSTVLGMLTHYTFAFQIAFHGLWVVAHFLKNRHKGFLWFGIPVLLLVIFGWFWAPVYVMQKFTAAQENHFSAGLLDWHRYLQVFVTSPFYWWSGFVNTTHYFLLPVYISAALYGLWTLIKRVLSKQFKSLFALSRPVLFLWGWLWIPLMGQVMMDAVQQTHTATIVRYTLLSSPAVYLLLALFCAYLFKKLSQQTVCKVLQATLGSALIVVGVLTIWPSQPLRYKAKFPTRQIAAYLEEHLQEQDIIAINGPLATPALLAFYLKKYRPSQPIVYWATLPRFIEKPVMPDAHLFENYDQVWLYFNRGNRRRGALSLRGLFKPQYTDFIHHIGPRRKLSVYTNQPEYYESDHP